MRLRSLQFSPSYAIDLIYPVDLERDERETEKEKSPCTHIEIMGRRKPERKEWQWNPP